MSMAKDTEEIGCGCIIILCWLAIAFVILHFVIKFWQDRNMAEFVEGLFWIAVACIVILNYFYNWNAKRFDK